MQKNKEFLEGILGEDGSDRKLIYKVQCAFESQLVELCDYVVGDGSLCFGRAHITPSDFTALEYIISTASNQVSTLILRCIWDNDTVMAFFSMIIRSKLHFIKCLEVYEYRLDDYKALNALLCQLPYLEELSLFEELNASDVRCLTRGVQLSQLRILNIRLSLAPCSHPEEVLNLLTFGSPNIEQVYIHRRMYSNLNFAMWKKLLCYEFGFHVFKKSYISLVQLYNSDEFSSLPQERFSYCSEVVLVNCGIDDEATEILANRLNTSVLEKLVLDFNRISDSGAVALAGCIARCSVVQEVSIQCKSIGDSGTDTCFMWHLVGCETPGYLKMKKRTGKFCVTHFQCWQSPTF